jgi:hypothetical protein
MLDKIYPKLKYIKFNTIKQNHFEKTIKVAELIKNPLMDIKQMKDLKQ